MDTLGLSGVFERFDGAGRDLLTQSSPTIFAQTDDFLFRAMDLAHAWRPSSRGRLVVRADDHASRVGAHRRGVAAHRLVAVSARSPGP